MSSSLRWVDHGVLKRVLHALARYLHALGGLDFSETSSMVPVPAPERGPTSARPSTGKGPRSWPWQTALVFLALTIASASPHETLLVEQTLNGRFLPDSRVRIIGDAAYDSDPLDRAIAACEIQLIARHRSNRSP